MSSKPEAKPINQLHATEPRWFAVHTRFKCEKFVAELLKKKGIYAYVPLRTSLRVYGGRKRKSEIPVISCYAFVQILESQYIPVLETENVLAFVRSAKNLMAIPESEMQNLKRIALDADLEWTSTPELFKEGQPITITAGSLAGMQGKLVRIEGKDKFVVELETIAHSLLVTMDPKFFS
jgi:transcription antitermination factor NusG